jgi:Asp-tRNA(Asn)/Glu-tRNA(Gln) amidotransferase A subunit family amidase
VGTPDHNCSAATELTAAKDAGEVSAVELALAAIERIERYDAPINAISVRDFDPALAAAREADARRARTETRPLLGVPIRIKDSFDVAGLATTWGIPPFKDFIPTEDAVAVARLRAAGAVIVGKTNVPFALGDLQTYNAIYGTTKIRGISPEPPADRRVARPQPSRELPRLVAADAVLARHSAQWRALFADFDIVVTPAAPTTAFAHDQSPDQWARTIPIDGADHDYADQLVRAGLATAPGLPATAAPIAAREGLPIGVQLIGPLFEDRTPLRFAELLERMFGGCHATSALLRTGYDPAWPCRVPGGGWAARRRDGRSSHMGDRHTGEPCVRTSSSALFGTPAGYLDCGQRCTPRAEGTP